jgi:hypothetical protein
VALLVGRWLLILQQFRNMAWLILRTVGVLLPHNKGTDSHASSKSLAENNTILFSRMIGNLSKNCPYSTFPHSWTWYSGFIIIEPILIHHYQTKSIVYIRIRFCIVQLWILVFCFFLGFKKYIGICVHCCSIIHNNFSALKIPIAPLIHSSNFPTPNP